MKKIFIATVIAGMFLLMSMSAWAVSSWWCWQADNHTGTGGVYTSMFVDNVHSFSGFNSSSRNEADVYWESPATSWATIKWGNTDHTGVSSRFIMGSNFSDCDNSANPDKYWDVYKGITTSFHVVIPAQDGASGNGNINVGVSKNNPSMAGIGNGMDLYFGWDEYADSRYGPTDDKVGLNFWTPSGSRQIGTATDGWIKPTSQISGVETWWTLCLQRIGNSFCWDVFLNGVWQSSPTLFLDPNGNNHSYIGGKLEGATTGFMMGERRQQPFNHETQWDYIAVTNAGALRGWQGPTPEPSSLLALGSGLIGLAGLVIRRRR